MPSKEKWLDLPAAAARLGFTWNQAYALCLSGQLTAERRGGRWYVTEGSVEEALGRLPGIRTGMVRTDVQQVATAMAPARGVTRARR